MKILSLTMLLATVLSLSGCATTGRFVLSDMGYHGVYPATKLDTFALQQTPDAWRHSEYVLCCVMVPVFIMDYPFSLVFDTLLLPYDLINRR